MQECSLDHESHTTITDRSADDDPACCRIEPSVEFKPNWTQWQTALSMQRESTARVQLGLATDRPIVMSGHQPIVFHNGILSKLIALDIASRRTGAQGVWIVPDQDAIDPGQVRLPMGRGESLSAQIVELLAPGSVREGVAVGSINAQHIEPAAHALLEELVERLNQYASMDSLASQFACATIELACDRLGIEMPAIIFASQLSHTDAMSMLINDMRSDPHGCAVAYNNAVQLHPQARVRELSMDNDRIELPLWAMRDGSARVAIDSKNIDQFSTNELSPRGLLMSAFARLHLSDLFIHGSGGWIYDRISELWMKSWKNQELAPMAMVSATQRLDLGFDTTDLVDPKDAMWEAHHVRHTPALAGDVQMQQRKDELVDQIEQRKAAGDDPYPLYRELQSLLIEYRTSHQSQIREYSARITRAKALSKQMALANDRTWPFVLFDQTALAALKEQVQLAMR